MENDPKSYAIIGAAMEVHRELKSGFLESVYQEALSLEFTANNIPFCREAEIPVYYKKMKLNSFFRADFVCYGEIMVEVKAIPALTGIEKGQLLNYLRATNLEIGLLVNFGGYSLDYQRLVFSNSRK